MTHTPTDSLRYIDARLCSALDYVIDQLGWSLLDGVNEALVEDLQTVLESAKDDIRAEMKAHQVDRFRYDDDRVVKSRAEIEYGRYFEMVWHPDPAVERPPYSWRGHLTPPDEHSPSPGVYEVTVDPESQEVHVRTVRVVTE
jgi:hypothetical protein